MKTIPLPLCALVLLAAFVIGLFGPAVVANFLQGFAP